jgi:hypothetical protein
VNLCGTAVLYGEVISGMGSGPLGWRWKIVSGGSDSDELNQLLEQYSGTKLSFPPLVPRLSRFFFF